MFSVPRFLLLCCRAPRADMRRQCEFSPSATRPGFGRSTCAVPRPTDCLLRSVGQAKGDKIPFKSQCGVEGSVGLPIANPVGTIYRREGFCLCPLRTKCHGEGCMLAKDHVRSFNSTPAFCTAHMEGFIATTCPTCTCLPTQGEWVGRSPALLAASLRCGDGMLRVCRRH